MGSAWDLRHPREVYGDPDAVIEFRPLEVDRAERKRREARFRESLDRRAPIPPRGDKSPKAKLARRLRTQLLAQRRRSAPWVGGRMVALKNNIEPHIVGRGRSARPTIGKTPLWEAWHAWALAELFRSPEAQASLDRWPLAGRVHLAWRYFPPDLEHLPDHTGVAETVADILEDLGAYVDDVQVAHTSGSLIEDPDPDRPRLEVWCRPCEGPAVRKVRAKKSPRRGRQCAGAPRRSSKNTGQQ